MSRHYKWYQFAASISRCAEQLVGLLVIIILIMGPLRPIPGLTQAGNKAKEIEEARELAAMEATGLDTFEGLSDETVTQPVVMHSSAEP